MASPSNHLNNTRREETATGKNTNKTSPIVAGFKCAHPCAHTPPSIAKVPVSPMPPADAFENAVLQSNPRYFNCTQVFIDLEFHHEQILSDFTVYCLDTPRKTYAVFYMDCEVSDALLFAADFAGHRLLAVRMYRNKVKSDPGESEFRDGVDLMNAIRERVELSIDIISETKY